MFLVLEKCLYIYFCALVFIKIDPRCTDVSKFNLNTKLSRLPTAHPQFSFSDGKSMFLCLQVFTSNYQVKILQTCK